MPVLLQSRLPSSMRKAICCISGTADNHGTALEGAEKILSQLYELMPSGLHIAGTGVTGYGEDLVKFRL